jgi:hypothetical protein
MEPTVTARSPVLHVWMLLRTFEQSQCGAPLFDSVCCNNARQRVQTLLAKHPLAQKGQLTSLSMAFIDLATRSGRPMNKWKPHQ